MCVCVCVCVCVCEHDGKSLNQKAEIRVVVSNPGEHYLLTTCGCDSGCGCSIVIVIGILWLAKANQNSNHIKIWHVVSKYINKHY